MQRVITLHSDADLLQLIIGSNPKGLEILFKTYHRQLWIFANQILKDADAAEDIVQEVFTKIWERRERLQIDTSLKAYLYTATKNTALNKIKSESRISWLDESFEENESLTENNTIGLIEAKSLEQKINFIIESLPNKCGLIFKMSRFENMSYKEIAEALQLSVKTVENQMSKALMILRKNLKNYLSVLFTLIFNST